jgi:hypothetical protein
MKKAVAASVVILALLGSAFSYGILVGRFKVFPYYQLRSAWFTAVEKVGGVANPVEKVARSGEGKLSIETEWEQIEGRKYNIAGRYRLSGIGGG